MIGIFEEKEEYAEDNNSIKPKKPLPLRILGIVLKLCFWGIIIGVNGILFWRMFSSGDPASMKTIASNEKLKTAYSAYLADTDKDKEPFAIYQREHKTITDEKSDKSKTDDDSDEKDNYGYFALTDVAIFPTASQAQVVFRYNNSTLDSLVEDYGLDFKPDKKEVYYEVTCRVVYDKSSALAPLEKTKRFSPFSSSRDWKSLYTYEQLVFDGLGNFDAIEEIYIDIYYINDVEYAEDPYGELCIYSNEYRNLEYKLDKKDIKAISQ